MGSLVHPNCRKAVLISLSLDKVPQDASFGFVACLQVESRFLSMPIFDKLDLNLTESILSHPLFRAAREDMAFSISATFAILEFVHLANFWLVLSPNVMSGFLIILKI
jgi:hypothetical protein